MAHNSFYLNYHPQNHWSCKYFSASSIFFWGMPYFLWGRMSHSCSCRLINYFSDIIAIVCLNYLQSYKQPTFFYSHLNIWSPINVAVISILLSLTESLSLINSLISLFLDHIKSNKHAVHMTTKSCQYLCKGKPSWFHP